MRIIFYFWMMCCGTLSAQTADQITHALAPLDLVNDLQTGYLLERAGAVTALEQPPPVRVGVAEYSMTHDLLARMAIAPPTNPFVAPEMLEDAINNANTPGTALPVSFILHEYDRIKSDAVDNGLLTVSNGRP